MIVVLFYLPLSKAQVSQAFVKFNSYRPNLYMVRKSDIISYNKKVSSLILCQTKSSEDVEGVSWRLNILLPSI